MSKAIFNYIILYIILILTQVIICNNICLFNIATPIIFIYLIIRLPLTLNINIVLTISFFTGLLIDIFSNTQGMHALSCTIVAFIRKSILRLYVPRDEDITDGIVSIKTIGSNQYFKYLMQRCRSGRSCSLGTAVCGNAPRVRIPVSAPTETMLNPKIKPFFKGF